MKMSPREIFALRDYLDPDLKGRTLSDARRVVSLTDIAGETCLIGRPRQLAGRSVLLAVADQLISGLAMIEIDGVARRMLLCPPDLKADHVNALIVDAEIDAIATDEPAGKGCHAHIGHAVALAQASDERRSFGLFSALRSPVGRDCRSGRAGWFAPRVSRSLDRSRLCVDRGRRRLCRQ